MILPRQLFIYELERLITRPLANISLVALLFLLPTGNWFAFVVVAFGATCVVLGDLANIFPVDLFLVEFCPNGVIFFLKSGSFGFEPFRTPISLTGRVVVIRAASFLCLISPVHLQISLVDDSDFKIDHFFERRD